ncbi:MAG: glycosyl transferase family 1 [Gemmatimonadota bacterium]|nr:MAG: glycosyl transferase family 1 [Gemmatimonadota bacterium]
MKVLVISTLYPNRSQPVHALFVEQRVRAMAKRFPVRVLCPVPWFPIAQRLARYRHRRRIPKQETRHGVDVRYPRFLSIPRFLKPLDGVFLFLSVWWTARSLRRDFDFDRIDAHLAFPDGWGAVLLGRLFRVPVAVTLRGHDVNDLPAYPVRGRQVTWTLREAGAVFPVAEALRDAALELGAPAERMTLVANGVDPARFSPYDPGEARAELGIAPEDRVILSVGHLVERKGFHHIVRALPTVVAQHSRARLVIVGAPGEEGDFSGPLQAAVREVGMEDRVRFVGAVNHDQLGKWYTAADVFCLASAKEGRANVLLESIACGTPVVATGVWGTPEIVSEDHLGILVEATTPDVLGGALAQALGRSWDRDRIAAHASRFSWDEAAATVERVLLSMGRNGR